MDKIVREFRALLKRLQKVDPKLHAETVKVIGKLQREFVKRYGEPKFVGWIDPWLMPKKP